MPYVTHVVFIVNVVYNYFLITNCKFIVFFLVSHSSPILFVQKEKLPNTLGIKSTENSLKAP
jgi:hypothetical protein